MVVPSLWASLLVPARLLFLPSVGPLTLGTPGSVVPAPSVGVSLPSVLLGVMVPSLGWSCSLCGSHLPSPISLCIFVVQGGLGVGKILPFLILILAFVLTTLLSWRVFLIRPTAGGGLGWCRDWKT